MARVYSYYIGDDWVIPVTVADSGGNPFNLSTSALFVTYFAPSGVIPDTLDITANATIVTSVIGAVLVVVPHAMTSLIPRLPQGRKGNLAHVQIGTIDTSTGLKITRLVVPIEPVDPASFDPRASSSDGPNYVRPSLFPFGGIV